MELYTMKYIQQIAQEGNFSAAAQACHIGQSALSQQVAKLEKELGVSLFHRTPRGVVLTEAGEHFLSGANEILRRADALSAEMADFAGMRKGRLDLGIITSLQCIRFGSMLSGFCAAYPNISVNIIEGGTYDLVNRLMGSKLDAAFINRPMGSLSPNLTFEKLGEDHYSLAVPVGHHMADRGMVSLKELENENFIFHQVDQVAADLCLAACRNAGFEPNIVCRSSNPTTGLYMAQGGLGVAFLPSEEFSCRKIDGIVELKIREPIVKEVGIACRSDINNPLVKALVQYTHKFIG